VSTQVVWPAEPGVAARAEELAIGMRDAELMSVELALEEEACAALIADVRSLVVWRVVSSVMIKLCYRGVLLSTANVMALIAPTD